MHTANPLQHRFKKQTSAYVAIAACLFAAQSAHANDNKLIQWHSTNIQILQGSGFALGPTERRTFTFQHSHRWTYGDNFVFYDNVNRNKGDYLEWHPRLSLGKMTGKNMSFGPIKDILLAGTLEVPQYSSARYLGGVGVDWNLLGFDYLKTNFYIRDNPDLAGSTWGTTFSWKKRFSIGPHKLMADGFMDMAGAEGARSGYQLVVPALLLDIGHYFGKDGKLFGGIEYQYWHNKFGIQGVNESAPQVELRWVF